MDSQTSQVLILANREDEHLALVTPYLEQPHVIDIANPHQGADLVYRVSGLTTEPEVFHGTRRISPHASVWVRSLPLPHDPLAGALTYALHDSQWASHPHDIMRASSRPHQLRLAQQMGFAVPPCTITASDEEARSFLEYHEWCIARLLRPPQIPDLDMQMKQIWYRRNRDSISLGGKPHVVEAVINTSHDVRIVVVANQVFAAAVTDYHPDTLTTPELRDWRLGLNRGTFEATEKMLPHRVANLCRQLVQACGLTMAVLDVVVDRRGEYVLLDILPMGNWAFIQQATRQPIGYAVAQLIMRLNHAARL